MEGASSLVDCSVKLRLSFKNRHLFKYHLPLLRINIRIVKILLQEHVSIVHSDCLKIGRHGLTVILEVFFIDADADLD
jgi:hypothetical protein